MKIVKKITEGCVIQSFDVKTGNLVEQEFVAGDEVDFEDCNRVSEETLESLYHPFDMKQPNDYEKDEE
jgi:hypothetical protein